MQMSIRLKKIENNKFLLYLLEANNDNNLIKKK